MRTEAELRAFKEDTQAFKEEMRAYRETTQTDTAAFKEEMRAFKEEGRQQNREMNRRCGELANKLGTRVEDLVAPSLPRIVQEVLDLSVRRKRADGRQQEYDALAVTPETICLASVKSTLRSADIDPLLNEELSAFRTFFPVRLVRRNAGTDQAIHGLLQALVAAFLNPPLTGRVQHVQGIPIMLQFLLIALPILLAWLFQLELLKS